MSKERNLDIPLSFTTNIPKLYFVLYLIGIYFFLPINLYWPLIDQYLITSYIFKNLSERPQPDEEVDVSHGIPLFIKVVITIRQLYSNKIHMMILFQTFGLMYCSDVVNN